MDNMAMSMSDELKVTAYYQGIVYYVCNVLDVIFGKNISFGTGIVCGGPEEPSNEVQMAMDKVLEKIEKLEMIIDLYKFLFTHDTELERRKMLTVDMLKAMPPDTRS